MVGETGMRNDKGERLPEVQFKFEVKVFGRATSEEAEQFIKEVREELVALEIKLNSKNSLRVHVGEHFVV